MHTTVFHTTHAAYIWNHWATRTRTHTHFTVTTPFPVQIITSGLAPISTPKFPVVLIMLIFLRNITWCVQNTAFLVLCINSTTHVLPWTLVFGWQEDISRQRTVEVIHMFIWARFDVFQFSKHLHNVFKAHFNIILSKSPKSRSLPWNFTFKILWAFLFPSCALHVFPTSSVLI